MTNYSNRQGQGPTILIVDDEPFIVDELASLLEDEGYCVVTANSLRLAVSMVECFPSLRLVMTDMLLPGESGLELIERLSKRDLAFILTSGHLDTDTTTLANTVFIKKPVDLSALVYAVKVAHQR
ncbi:MAG: hypothetical protein RLZZ227_2429 [Pseudomonadota bacterium]